MSTTRLREMAGRGWLIVAAVAMAVAAAGCGKRAEEPPAVTTPVGPPTKTQTSLSNANISFGFALLQRLWAEQPGGNVFISPCSIAMALDMTVSGAVGETQRAMMQTLALDGLTLADVNQASLDLRKVLVKPDTKVTLSIANSIWLGKGIKFVPDFLDMGSKFYGAKLANADFESDRAARTINGWVKDNTDGKIPELLDVRPMPGIVCELVNAVYFEGRWTDVFEKSRTAPRSFTLLDGSKKRVPMMSRSGAYEYLERPGFQAIRLPYGKERLAMYVFLPAQSSSLDTFCKTLTAENWAAWMKTFGTQSGEIVLPKFRAEYGAKLNDALKAMGMGIAFEQGKADFSGMCGKPGEVWIDQVLHKTYVDVDEEGTKAAAATSAVMTMAGELHIPGKPFEMVVDRPFFCAIVDRATGAVLFAGAIVDPEEAASS